MPFLCFILLICWPQATPFGLPNSNGVALVDSIRLTSQSNRWLLSKQRNPIQIPVMASRPVQFGSGSRYKVCFDSLRVLKNPDGVYEVYLSTSSVSASGLLPESPYFAGVLDTYTLTATNNPTRVCLDLPPGNQIMSAGPISRCVVSILFRGNKLPDGRFAQEAGSLTGGHIVLQAAN